MHTATQTPVSTPAGVMTRSLSETAPQALNQYQIIRRNGAVVPFEPNKIAVAMMKAFLAVHGTQGAASASVREVVESLTQSHGLMGAYGLFFVGAGLIGAPALVMFLILARAHARLEARSS